ncbi:MAG: nucleotidyltransferase substrate binding protein [Bdellovibrionaceae bacterium]|nr:nucleotidyltransferase substrate binding protein [Pseudobdellovibrionaceae bacterium]
MGVSTTELEKAVKSLEEALELHQKAETDIEKKAFRDAVIQRFEFSIELSWKTSMKILGSATAAAKPAIREMARNNLIQDPESWLKFIDARNETSHTYDEDVAQKVYLVVLSFLPFAKELLQKLKQSS